jgi:hypothetical protein
MQILEIPGNDAASAGGDQVPRPRSLSVSVRRRRMLAIQYLAGAARNCPMVPSAESADGKDWA